MRPARKTDLVYDSKDFPWWKRGDRVLCCIECPANDNKIGDVGTVTVDYAPTRDMGKWTRVHVKWDRNGLNDVILPWEIRYA